MSPCTAARASWLASRKSPEWNVCGLSSSSSTDSAWHSGWRLLSEPLGPFVYQRQHRRESRTLWPLHNLAVSLHSKYIKYTNPLFLFSNSFVNLRIYYFYSQILSFLLFDAKYLNSKYQIQALLHRWNLVHYNITLSLLLTCMALRHVCRRNILNASRSGHMHVHTTTTTHG